MEESRGLKTRRNYRRRHCSHGGDDEEEDEEDDDDEKDEKDEKNFGLNFESRAGEDGNLKQPSASSVIPVDEAVGAYDSALGSVDGGSLSAPPPSPPREASGAQGVGSGRNGARIASGIGFHMLRAMGWTENTGLGQSRKGMVDPILPTSKTGNLGLGFNASSTSVHDTQQEAIRHLQKAKREERDRKLKLKNYPTPAPAPAADPPPSPSPPVQLLLQQLKQRKTFSVSSWLNQLFGISGIDPERKFKSSRIARPRTSMAVSSLIANPYTGILS
ncbi:hypothetical protein AXG93_2255s1180 [Marchantia polymorpha subsp. ruderalis]|uniref:G-patch domain-containing protein n=1 Tax=Marchantia polymorpha subsp. ruderalis TaxID=1480154 RepID=A0A176W9V3_MARPO|nr:hypothetical protein AXG93_2255s1180 [Marchantia polymorpha subsp. ruderalis]